MTTTPGATSSNSTTFFVNPQLSWRPFRNLTTRLEYAHRDLRGNMVSNSMQATQCVPG